MPNQNASANDFRAQAKALLQSAAALDNKKPFLLVCNGGYDEPTTTVAWMSEDPSDEQIGEIMGFDADGDHKLYARVLSLEELLPFLAS